MTKIRSFPSLYNESTTLNITKLKSVAAFDGTIKSGTISWSRNGRQMASIEILINTLCNEPYIELKYNCNGEKIDYQVKLVALVSNLGRGKIWYFLCPVTGQRCRKFYLINKFFLHRNAFKNAMYECQTYSKEARSQIKALKKLFDSKKAYQILDRKHFRKYYAGKPTNKYLKLIKKIKQLD